MRRRNSSAAFTLVELLVVVAIIGLLIAILLPSLAKARNSAKRAACLANTHSLSNSLHAFMHDWNTLIPFDAPTTPNFWVLRLAPYGNLEKVRICPAMSGPNPSPVDAPGTAFTPWIFANPAIGSGCYGLNGWFYTTKGLAPSFFTSTSLVAPPPWANEFFTWPLPGNDAAIPSLGECTSSIGFPRPGDQPPASAFLLEQGPGSLKTDQMQRFAIARHDKSVNIAFADGHAESVSLGDLWTLRWTPGWNRNTAAPIP